MSRSTKKRSGPKHSTKVSSGEPEKMEKAQIWSIDVLLAVVIFISILLIFYVTLGTNSKLTIKDLQTEANQLVVEFENNPKHSFMESNSVNVTKLEEFSNDTVADYEGVKSDLGVKGDFCIYFEDESGNLVLLSDNRTGIGSDKINVSGTPCGQKKW